MIEIELCQQEMQLVKAALRSAQLSARENECPEEAEECEDLIIRFEQAAVRKELALEQYSSYDLAN